jgi:hypothetical protein
MENVSKALIFVASVLIAVMLLSVMVYMFKTAGGTATSIENVMSSSEIDAFNNQFLVYDTVSEDSEIVIGNGSNTKKYLTYKKIFNKSSDSFNGENAQNLYNQALIAASQNFNKVTDVVSAINLAINVNSENNNDYKYNYTEIESSVEIIVDLNGKRWDYNTNTLGDTGYKYLLLEANSEVKSKNIIYGTNLISTDEATNFENKCVNFENNFNTSNKVSTYKLLSALRNSKVVTYDNKDYTVYQYYFEGKCIINEKTGLVETVKFTLLQDNNF